MKCHVTHHVTLPADIKLGILSSLGRVTLSARDALNHVPLLYMPVIYIRMVRWFVSTL